MTYEEFQLKVKEIAEKAGLTQYELYYSEQEDQSVRVMNHEVSSFSSVKKFPDTVKDVIASAFLPSRIL